MVLPALVCSFNLVEASEGLKCRLWIDRNLKAHWRAKLPVLLDFSNRAEASEGLALFSNIFSGCCVLDDFCHLMLEEFCTTRDLNPAVFVLKRRMPANSALLEVTPCDAFPL